MGSVVGSGADGSGGSGDCGHVQRRLPGKAPGLHSWFLTQLSRFFWRPSPCRVYLCMSSGALGSWRAPPQALQAPACHENLVKVGGYILGEFGNLIAGDPRSR